jgi:endoglycosylceramidase
MYWQYKHWADPTGGTNEGLYRDDAKPSTVKTTKLAVLVHPYPQAIAGTPTSMSWNAASKVLHFSYTPKRATGQTDVFLPALTCKHGCTVKVSGGKVVRRTTLHAFVAAKAGARNVTVTVKPS